MNIFLYLQRVKDIFQIKILFYLFIFLNGKKKKKKKRTTSEKFMKSIANVIYIIH